MTAMQRVIVAAPQAALREGVRNALKESVVLEEADTADALARLAGGDVPDLLLVDAALFGDEISIQPETSSVCVWIPVTSW